MGRRSWIRKASLGAAVVACTLAIGPSLLHADGNLGAVNHIIIVMQENRSFDNYFGVLAYVSDTPYHGPKRGREARLLELESRQRGASYQSVP